MISLLNLGSLSNRAVSRLRSTGATLCALLMGVAVCRSSLPDLPSELKPSPEPDFPTEWDVFSPPVTGTSTNVPAGSPTISEWTRTGRSNDTVILTGDKLSNAVGSDSGKDTQFIVFGQSTTDNAALRLATIQQLDGLKAAVILPLELPTRSTYLLWPKNSIGVGYPVAMNRTEAWWVNPDEYAIPGQTISVFGRNLSHDNGTKLSWIYIKTPGNIGQWATVTSVNPYRIEFKVPSSLGNGNYEIWIHNGHGGKYGWSGPLSLKVASPYVWDGSVFDVRKYGAQGDGFTDDTDSVNAAYSAALQQRDRSQTHPTLYFPKGVYMMRYGLGLERDIRISGDGKQSTTIRCNEDFNKPRLAKDGHKLGLLYGNGGAPHNIEIRDLTLDAKDNFGSPNNQLFLLYGQFEAGARDIRLTNVKIETLLPGVGGAFFNNVTRLELIGCEFVGGQLMLFNSRQVRVNGCTFLGANDSIAAIVQRGTSNLSITNCYAADFNIHSPTGQGLGRFLAANGDYGSQRNVYVSDNITVDCGPRAGAVDENSGEQVMCEGNWTLFEGTPSNSTPTSVSFASLSVNHTGATTIVTNGKGLGQHRQITGYDSATKTITVSPAWKTTPDPSSTLIIANAADRWVIYRNSFDGKNDYALRYSATTGIEMYGGCYNWIGDNNNISNMRFAIYAAGIEQGKPIPGIAPCYFNYYTSNIVKSCYAGIYVGCGMPARSLDCGVGIIGNVFINNQINDITTAGLVLSVHPQTAPGTPMDMTLFEHNSFTDVSVGVIFKEFSGGTSVRNTIFINNRIDRGRAALIGSIGTSFATSALNPSFDNNTWVGFERSYAGIISSAARRTVIGDFEPDPTPQTAIIAGADTVITSGSKAPVDPSIAPTKLNALSTRSFVGTGDSVQIAGFSVAGTNPKQILIRANGPSLTPLGVSGAIKDPLLTLYSGKTILHKNDDWATDDLAAFSLEAAMKRTGAFQWSRGSKDAALLVTLAPGTYSAKLEGMQASTGVGMIEVYDADITTSTSQLVNVSTRTETSSGANVLIAGFVIDGPSSKKILIRASGPALAPFGVMNFLADPFLKVFSGQTLLAQNNDWASNSTTSGLIELAATSAGAFSWPSGSKDAALFMTLPPGAYTAHVEGRDSATGVALIEIYEIK